MVEINSDKGSFEITEKTSLQEARDNVEFLGDLNSLWKILSTDEFEKLNNLLKSVIKWLSNSKLLLSKWLLKSNEEIINNTIKSFLLNTERERREKQEKLDEIFDNWVANVDNIITYSN